MGPIQNYYVIPGIQKPDLRELEEVERKSIMKKEVKKVCDAFNVEYDEKKLNSRTRLRNYVTIRQVSMFLFVKKHGLTLKIAGDFFNKDHATVIHSCKTVSALYSYDKQFIKTINPLIGDIKI